MFTFTFTLHVLDVLHCYAVVFSLYFWRPRALDVGRHSKFMLIDWLIDWLPVHQQILYKVAPTAFDCVRSTSPAQPTSGTSVCQSLTSLGGHTSVRLNTVKCWFLAPGPSSANGASMLQPPSSGTRCLHTCAQPPSVMNSSEMGWRPISSHRPTPSSENFCLRAYTTLTLTCNKVHNEFVVYLVNEKSTLFAAFHRKPLMLGLWCLSLFLQAPYHASQHPKLLGNNIVSRYLHLLPIVTKLCLQCILLLRQQLVATPE